MQDAQVPAQSRRKDAATQSGYEGVNLGSYPLLTPPAGRLILTLRINKAILKCAAIVVGINQKPDLKRTNKPSAQDKQPSARQKVLNSHYNTLIFIKIVTKL